MAFDCARIRYVSVVVSGTCSCFAILQKSKIVPAFVFVARKICGKSKEDVEKEESKGGLKSVLQPIADAARYCRTKQMCLLYAPVIFTGDADY